MGASGFSLRFQRLEGAEQADLATVQAAFWEKLTHYARRFAPYETVWNGYLDEASPHDEGRWFTQRKDTVNFWFPDFAGCCGRSAGAAEHWLSAATAASWSSLEQTAQEHGWLLVGPAPSLAEVVWNSERGYGWLPLDGDLWEFSFDPDRDSGGLHGDDRFRPFSELDEEAWASVCAAAARRLCPCSLCKMLRPDAEFEAQMRGYLDHEDPDFVQTASWYLRQSARPSLASMLRCTQVETGGSLRSHAEGCRQLGEKLPAAEVQAVLERWDDAAGAHEQAGVLGLLSGVKLEPGPAFAARFELFERALRAGTALAEIASEFSGYGTLTEGREALWAERLVDRIGTSDELDHNVALTLLNLYLRAPAPPDFVLEALERLARHDSEQVRGIAAFACARLAEARGE